MHTKHKAMTTTMEEATKTHPQQYNMVDLLNNSLTTAQHLNTYKAADIVNLFFPITLIVVGIFVNVLTVLVMRSPHFRYVSTSFYFTTGALNDLFSLLLSLLPHWLFLNYPSVYKTRYMNDKVCAFFNFYGYCNTDITLILTASMTLDRAYAIKFPLKVAGVNTARRARFMILFSVIYVCLQNGHLLFCSSRSPPEMPERLCIISPSGEHFKFFVKRVWPWFHLTFIGLCLIVISVGNVDIIRNVRRSVILTDNSRHNAHSTQSDAMRRESGASHSVFRSGRLRQMTTMILAESITTVILSCPFTIYDIISKRDPNLHKDPAKIAMNQLLFSITFYMLYSNKCVNFFLYVVSGHKFRLALKQLLHCRSSNPADQGRGADGGGGRSGSRIRSPACSTDANHQKEVEAISNGDVEPGKRGLNTVNHDASYDMVSLSVETLSWSRTLKANTLKSIHGNYFEGDKSVLTDHQTLAKSSSTISIYENETVAERKTWSYSNSFSSVHPRRKIPEVIKHKTQPQTDCDSEPQNGNAKSSAAVRDIATDESRTVEDTVDDSGDLTHVHISAKPDTENDNASWKSVSQAPHRKAKCSGKAKVHSAEEVHKSDFSLALETHETESECMRPVVTVFHITTVLSLDRNALQTTS